MIPKVEQLDKSDPTQIADYERGFYEAFLPYDNPGIRALWIWNDQEKRLKTRIPYEDQEIFFIRDDHGRIRSAGAFNMALREFQSGAYGFSPPQDDFLWFETLTTFAEGGELKKLFCLEHARRVLTKGGHLYSYATCNEATLPLHQKIGAEVLERSVTDGQVRYYIRFDLRGPFIQY